VSIGFRAVVGVYSSLQAEYPSCGLTGQVGWLGLKVGRQLTLFYIYHIRRYSSYLSRWQHHTYYPDSG